MNGKLTRIDEPAMIGEIPAEHEKLRPLIERAEQRVEPILEVYRRIYERCRQTADRRGHLSGAAPALNQH